MSDSEFKEYWQKVHGPIASKLTGLRRYVQNVASYPEGKGPEYQGVAEMWFDHIEGMKQAFATEQGQTTLKDMNYFVGSHTTIFADEHFVVENDQNSTN